jgi:hypothetical protein
VEFDWGVGQFDRAGGAPCQDAHTSSAFPTTFPLLVRRVVRDSRRVHVGVEPHVDQTTTAALTHGRRRSLNTAYNFSKCERDHMVTRRFTSSRAGDSQKHPYLELGVRSRGTDRGLLATQLGSVSAPAPEPAPRSAASGDPGAGDDGGRTPVTPAPVCSPACETHRTTPLNRSGVAAIAPNAEIAISPAVSVSWVALRAMRNDASRGRVLRYAH